MTVQRLISVATQIIKPEIKAQCKTVAIGDVFDLNQVIAIEKHSSTRGSRTVDRSISIAHEIICIAIETPVMLQTADRFTSGIRKSV